MKSKHKKIPNTGGIELDLAPYAGRVQIIYGAPLVAACLHWNIIPPKTPKRGTLKGMNLALVPLKKSNKDTSFYGIWLKSLENTPNDIAILSHELLHLAFIVILNSFHKKAKQIANNFNDPDLQELFVHYHHNLLEQVLEVIGEKHD